jgi:hypothetical protein
MAKEEVDESLWIGNDHKISISGNSGKMKFKKRKKNQVPKPKTTKGLGSGTNLSTKGRGPRSPLGTGSKPTPPSPPPMSRGPRSPLGEREMTDAEKDKREEIVLSLKKKTKDFKERYGDKWKEVMYATATKMAMGEEKDKKESSSKKDKINLKPTMDETMKKYKDLLKGLKEKKSTTEDTDKDTPGTQGDNAEWQKKRSAVLKKFGVKSCAALGTEEEKKACYKALDDAHVADHEEEVKKEQVEVDARKKGYKEAMKRIESRRTKVAEKDKKKKDWFLDDPQEGPTKPKGVKEAVTLGGVEYGEQNFDHGARLDHAAPNLEINMRMAEFTEQGLEGPYLWKGETYFFDRKVGGWYSVSSEDYVDDAMNAELGLHYTKDGGYKKQFAS